MGVNTTQPTVPQKRAIAKTAGTNQASDPPKSGPKPPGAGSKAGGPVVKAAVQGSTLKSADIKTAVSNAPLPGHPPGKRGDDPAAGRVADRRVATPGTSGVPLAGPAESRGAPAKAPDSRPASKPAGNPTSPVKADSPHSDVAGRRGDAVSKLIGDTAQVSGMSNANQRALNVLRQRYEQGQVDRSEALKQRARIDMDNTTTQNARTQALVKVAEVGASVAQGVLEGSKLAVGGITLAASGGNVAAATAAQVAFTQVADSAAAISAEATGDAAVQARFAKEGQSVPAALIKAAQGQKVDPGEVLNKLGGDTASALTNVVTTAVTGGLGNVAKGGLMQVASKAPLSLGTRAVEVTAGALGHGAANVLTTAVNQEVDKAKIRGDGSLSEAQKQQQLAAIDKHRGTNLAFAFLQGGAGQVAGAAWTDQGKLNVGGLAGQAASNVGLGVAQEKLTSEGQFDWVKSVTSNTIGTLQEAAKHSPRVGQDPVTPQGAGQSARSMEDVVGRHLQMPQMEALLRQSNDYLSSAEYVARFDRMLASGEILNVSGPGAPREPGPMSEPEFVKGMLDLTQRSTTGVDVGKAPQVPLALMAAGVPVQPLGMGPNSRPTYLRDGPLSSVVTEALSRVGPGSKALILHGQREAADLVPLAERPDVELLQTSGVNSVDELRRISELVNKDSRIDTLVAVGGAGPLDIMRAVQSMFDPESEGPLARKIVAADGDATKEAMLKLHSELGLRELQTIGVPTNLSTTGTQTRYWVAKPLAEGESPVGLGARPDATYLPLDKLKKQPEKLLHAGMFDYWAGLSRSLAEAYNTEQPYTDVARKLVPDAHGTFAWWRSINEGVGAGSVDPQDAAARKLAAATWAAYEYSLQDKPPVGWEHNVFDASTVLKLGKTSLTHGEWVGLGSVLHAQMYARLTGDDAPLAQMRGTYADMGLPLTWRDLDQRGIDRDKLVEVLERSLLLGQGRPSLAPHILLDDQGGFSVSAARRLLDEVIK